MRTFIFTVFVLYCAAVAINLLMLVVFSFPREQKDSSGHRVISVIVGSGLAIWAAHLLWGAA